MSRRRRPLEGGTIKQFLYSNNLIDQGQRHGKQIAQLQKEAVTKERLRQAYSRRGEDRGFGGWGQSDVAASQTAVTLSRAAAWEQSLIMTRDGSVTALEVAVTEARTAGDLTVTVYVNGTATEMSVTINAEDDQFNEEIAAIGEYEFSAGDAITLRLTTTSAWAPTTADLQCRLLIATD